MSFSNYLETEILDHVFAGNAYTAPSTLYVALFTTATGDAGTGTEVSGGSYARQTASFSVTGNTATNTANIEFPASTASWGTVTHCAIYDSLTGGNMLSHGALTASKAVETGDILRFSAGEIDITLD